MISALIEAKDQLQKAARDMHRLSKQPGWMGLGSCAEVDLHGIVEIAKEIVVLGRKMQQDDEKVKAG